MECVRTSRPVLSALHIVYQQRDTTITSMADQIAPLPASPTAATSYRYDTPLPPVQPSA